jgi:hypothetical protein
MQAPTTRVSTPLCGSAGWLPVPNAFARGERSI